MDALRLFIPGVPAAKGRPRFVRATGRAYTPAKTAQAERSIAQFAAEAMRGRDLFDTPVEVTLIATFIPPKRTKKAAALEYADFKGTRSDLDNYIKTTMDALNGVVWVDDALVAAMHAAKVYGSRPCLSIEVRRCNRLSWPMELS